MRRKLYSDLLAWKQSSTRKPLILLGARQVGKTYLLQTFGKQEYSQVAYVNCDNNTQLATLFADYDMSRVVRTLSALTGISIRPYDTLIILDEVQELRGGLAALKYFCEQLPDYHVAVAGSLLGITLHEGTSFPVGKVDMLCLRPMDFGEFLLAMGQEPLLERLQACDWATLTALHSTLVEWLRQYYFVGGMPEAVATYVRSQDIWAVRTVQEHILQAYANDMSKHAPLQQVQRINMVWQSIPSQLARTNKKFIYGAVKKGARAKEFELAIQWLVDAGLVHKVFRCAKPALPLKFYQQPDAFKLFLLDVGLLGALSQTPPQAILIGSGIFSEYKGAFSENYVLSQLLTLPHTFVYYYSNDSSTLEIDFLVQHDARVVPVEVKAEENLRSKSLRQFITDHPELHGLRLSMSPFRQQEWVTNVPLFAAAQALEAV